MQHPTEEEKEEVVIDAGETLESDDEIELVENKEKHDVFDGDITPIVK